MNNELVAQFEKRFPRGPCIFGDLWQSTSGFSVTVLFGPSGCGKTTFLRSLAGLERPDVGTISFHDEVWFDAQKRICLSPRQRDISFLFQDYALFPHLTVAENIGYGLRKLNAEERRHRVTDIVRLLQLDGLEARYPAQISGGQQQRVALARTLVRRSRLLLLDEPLSALDTSMRDQLRTELRRLLGEFETPVVVVTHDRTEAIALADQVIVMNSGKVRQSGSVHEVFSHPQDSEVARIVGMETVVLGEVTDVTAGLATIRIRDASLLAVAPVEPVRHVYVCIKGEDVILQRGAHGESSVRNHLPATVRWIMPEGPLLRIGLSCGFELTALVTRPACEELRLQVGEKVTAMLKASSLHLIPKD